MIIFYNNCDERIVPINSQSTIGIDNCIDCFFFFQNLKNLIYSHLRIDCRKLHFPKTGKMRADARSRNLISLLRCCVVVLGFNPPLVVM
jgi:hypothetical protein